MATEDQVLDKKIYVTKNLDKFKLVLGNRVIDHAKVRKIKESIRKYKQFVPLIVNKDLAIIDGQHRWCALRELGLECEYIIDPDLTIREIQEMNTHQSKWTLLDAIRSYATLGYQDYINLNQLYAQYGHKFQLSTLLGVISTSAFNGPIREGKYKLSNEQMRQTMGVLSKISQVGDYFPQACTLKFSRTYKKCLGITEFSHERFMQQLPKNARFLEPSMKDREIMAAIDKIYNFNRKKDLLSIESILLQRR